MIITVRSNSSLSSLSSDSNATEMRIGSPLRNNVTNSTLHPSIPFMENPTKHTQILKRLKELNIIKLEPNVVRVKVNGKSTTRPIAHPPQLIINNEILNNSNALNNNGTEYSLEDIPQQDIERIIQPLIERNILRHNQQKNTVSIIRTPQEDTAEYNRCLPRSMCIIL